MTLEERAAGGIVSLPQSLAEAVDVMQDSELVAEALGLPAADVELTGANESSQHSRLV